ncbi:MAG: RidA family protein [Bacteroidetes bacterium]|nr:RidA family protein [Bacteroidota bacterium]
MSERLNISSNTHWEDVVGYSRVVRIGNIVEVAGTTASQDGKVIHENNAFEQAYFILKKIEKSLAQAEVTLSDVIRTRVYVININDWEGIAKAHHEFFKDIKPVTTLIEVSALIQPGMLVEIEASAVVKG